MGRRSAGAPLQGSGLRPVLRSEYRGAAAARSARDPRREARRHPLGRLPQGRQDQGSHRSAGDTVVEAPGRPRRDHGRERVSAGRVREDRRDVDDSAVPKGRAAMKIGLQIPFFTWPGGAKEIGPTLTKIARTADQGGVDLIGLMDHLFQIQSIRPPQPDMLEAYTTLGYLAANTSRARPGTIVTGAVYRYPGVIAKIVTTLDVLSGGRGMLGIGAGWNEYEAKSLGIPFQPVAERFDWLEDTLRLCLQMWKGDESRLDGQKFGCERPT